MSEQVKKATQNAEAIFTATEEALQNDWNQTGKIQFPTLLGMVLVRLNATADAAVEVDTYMRNFVRKHPSYHVSRGAKGGIELMSAYDKRQANKAAVEAAKVSVREKIDAKVASMTSATTATVATPDQSDD